MLRAATALATLLLCTGPAIAAPKPPSETEATAPSRDRTRMNQRVFDKVWLEVKREYYDPRLHGVDWNAARDLYRPQALAATDDRGLYRALDQMLDLLDDDHAGASPPAVARRQDALRTRRAIMGVTLYPREEGGYRIERVRAGSPAEEAGLRAGWLLDTDQPSGWGPETDVAEGVPVRLSLIDDTGVPRIVAVTPRVMEPLPAFVADRTRPGVVVLRIEGFEVGLGQWMGEQLAQTPPDADVVVDLRGNPGGRLLEADAVLSCFLPRQRPWATRTTRSGRAVVLKVEAGCGDLRGPIANDVAVLVDGSSRSAAELTPAVLQEAERAVVIGEQTAGAVLISQETTLPDGGRLSLSRADFVTTGGVRLEKRGVIPDQVITTTEADRRAGRDPALEAALAALAVPTVLAREAEVTVQQAGAPAAPL